MRLSFRLNGRPAACDVDPNVRLLDLLRETFHLTGTKEGCGEGECGACTVLVDGHAVNSCLLLAPQIDGCDVRTIEGLADGDRLHPLQEAFVAAGAVQCGFCTPGFLISAYALLQDRPDPTDDEIRAAFEGNLCRCTGYEQIVDAVRSAARRMRTP